MCVPAGDDVCGARRDCTTDAAAAPPQVELLSFAPKKRELWEMEQVGGGARYDTPARNATQRGMVCSLIARRAHGGCGAAVCCLG